MPLLILSISWLLGIFAGFLVHLPLWSLAAGAIPLPFLPVVKQRRFLIMTALVIVTFIGGCLVNPGKTNIFGENTLAFYNGKGRIVVTGMIDSDPDIRDRSSEFRVSVDSLHINNTVIEISGRALVKTTKTVEYHYGDMVRIEGIAEGPRQKGDFDYKEYLARDDIYSLFSYPFIELIERNKGSPILSAIYTVRNSLYSSLSRALPEPQCALAQGMLLGTTGSIPYSLRRDFNTTGTTHLLAISGLNLSILLGIFLSMGIWLLGKNHGLYIWLTLIMIWLYSMLTGMKPPIVRSAVMGSMFLLAEFLGRQQNAGIMVFFTAALMSGFNPAILGDASFQLSFAAMSGLVFVYPKLESQFTGDRDYSSGTDRFLRFIMESTFITAAAIITTWPLVAYYFGIFSLTGLPATFLAMPAMPYIIIFSAITAIAGIIAAFPAQILGWIAWLFLSYLLMVIEAFAGLPLSRIEVREMPAWSVVGYYIILATTIFAINHRSSPSVSISGIKDKMVHIYERLENLMLHLPIKLVVLPLLGIAIMLSLAVAALPDGNLHVSVLNVGQGDAILIQTPGNKTILIDGGPSPGSIKLELGKKMPFWQRTIDMVIVTQPQADHITGILEVLRTYNVRSVVETGLPYKSSVYAQLIDTVNNKRIDYRQIRNNRQIQIDNDILIEVLHPPQFNPADQTSVNDNSLVLRLKYRNRHFLFTGDIGEPTENYLISQRIELGSDVLKVAHHGSRTSTSDRFLQRVQPAAAAISVSANNTFGHPGRETVERILKFINTDNLFVTSRCGTVEFITDGDRLWVKTEY